MSRTERYLYWGTPILFCLFVYWYGLRTWFMQDDFAWLSLPLAIHNWHDFLDAAFAPKAQGTIRPWSERLFFLGFQHLFGFDARPFRVWVFLNQFVDLALLSALMWRITGSRVAGLAAPLLWTANTSLTTSMAWTSAYNEIQCSGFLLGSLYLFVRYTQTGERRYYWWQCLVFLLGFGSLELNVVYPAIALVYAVCCAPSYWRATLPLFGVSAVYTLVHRFFAPPEVSYFYKMYFDGSLVHSFRVYWAWALGVMRVPDYFVFSARLAVWLTALLTLALLAFIAERLWRRHWVVLLGPAWYLIVLAPVLPLRNHVTDYYLTMPSIGLAILGAYAVGIGWRKNWGWRAAVLSFAAVYLVSSVAVDRFIMRSFYDRSKRVEVLVESVAFARQLHPKSVILLNGIGQDLFWGAIYDRAFRALELPDVYLTPESRRQVTDNPYLSSIEDRFLAPAMIREGLRKHQIQVYEVSDQNLRNITGQFARTVAAKYGADKPKSVDVSNRLFADQLGAGWYPGDEGYRWMGKTASVYLGGPKSPLEKLYLKGVCPEQAVTSQPQQIRITVNGQALAPLTITRSNLSFAVNLELPPSFIGQSEVQVTLTVDHTVQVSSDPRDLGLAFGIIAIQ